MFMGDFGYRLFQSCSVAGWLGRHPKKQFFLYNNPYNQDALTKFQTWKHAHAFHTLITHIISRAGKSTSQTAFFSLLSVLKHTFMQYYVLVLNLSIPLDSIQSQLINNLANNALCECYYIKPTEIKPIQDYYSVLILFPALIYLMYYIIQIAVTRVIYSCVMKLFICNSFRYCLWTPWGTKQQYKNTHFRMQPFHCFSSRISDYLLIWLCEFWDFFGSLYSKKPCSQTSKIHTEDTIFMQVSVFSSNLIYSILKCKLKL